MIRALGFAVRLCFQFSVIECTDMTISALDALTIICRKCAKPRALTTTLLLLLLSETDPTQVT